MNNTILTHRFSLKVSVLTVAFWLVSVTAGSAANVCSEGVGIPPFLSPGGIPNMLIVLDNSGSMLDMAYQDKINDSYCFDDTYLAVETTPGDITLGKQYTGNFESDKWYVWTEVAPTGSVSAWTSGTCYVQDEIVLDNSKLWKAFCSTPNCDSNSDGADDGCLAAGSNVFEDNDNGGLVWADYFDWPEWKAAKYVVGDVVKYQNHLYYCTSPVNVSDADADEPPTDNPGKWSAIDYTWRPGKGYADGDIVTYKGMVFEANRSFTSSATGLFDDRENLADPTSDFPWDRIDEGYFAEYTVSENNPTPCTDVAAGISPSYTYEPVDSSDSSSRIDAAITLLDSAGNKITDVVTQTPAKVGCFAAQGNFLNWASASKFDIQKRILTGGKFSAGYENKNADGSIEHTTSPQTDIDDDRLIAENRGCTGKGFTKQVTLVPDADPTKAIVLTMRVRGSADNDWIDTTDDTTRIEILAVSEGGFDNSDCQAVVDAIEAGASFNSISNLINNCLAGGSSDERAALNHGLQYCEKLRDGGDRDINTIVGDCEALFNDPTTPVSPATIDPRNGAYACYGIFDENTVHSDREGYMGRCWAVPSSLTCYQTPCPNGDPLPNYFNNLGDGEDYMCAADGFLYRCDGNFNANQNTCNQPWTAVYTQTAEHDTTIPCPPLVSTAGWSDDYDGIAGSDGIAAGGCHDGTFAEGADCGCLGKALEDYCKDLAVPEVIDPSDLASSTLDYLGLPGNLVDSGVVSQLGTEDPLAVYKGYIQYTLPDGTDTDEDDQHNDRQERPDGPRGVFYDIASTLRIGAMAFKVNGSDYECDILQTTCTKNTNGVQYDVCLDSDGNFDGTLLDDETSDCYYCSIREPIIKFCPEDNSDGAEVIADIKPVMEIDDNLLVNDPSDDLEVWDHYNELVAAVNDTRGTSWTPLAEAMYNAFGYYGQRSDRCLTKDAVGNCLDFTVDPSVDPVEYWCQDNHILIITEGASTADINNVVANFATAGGDGDTDIGTCSSGLDGSTYLDDMTYFGHNASASDLFAVPQINEEDKGYITTHIITTGSLESGTDECSPLTIMTNAATNGGTTLYSGENPDTLQANLESVLSDVLNRVSAGSAASVISSSRSGSGAVYQAIFWPELLDKDSGKKVQWAGDVHSLFIDQNGFFFEDTNENGRMEPSADEGADGLDRRVIFFYNEDARRTMACLKIEDFFANDLECPDVPTGKDQYCDSTDPNTSCLELTDINFLWSAAERLAEATAIDANRTDIGVYLSATNMRQIYTWEDLDNDGIVDKATEWLPFTNNALFPSPALDVTPDAGTDPWGNSYHNRGTVADDFAFVTQEEREAIAGVGASKEDAAKIVVNWIRGQDYAGLRGRQFPIDGSDKTWRLGDVIHSTPTVVARPAEAYHLIYKDPSYALFAKRWADRRQMVYYGANDGMLHATNGGFYHEGTQSFCRELNSGYDHTDPTSEPCNKSGPLLGTEMWAYIPYNLIPHLKCLTSPSYDHKYYVDQRPRIFDAQIFEDDCDYSSGFANCSNAVHPGGWGTILVGSMRFGGGSVDAATDIDSSAGDDNRKFVSAFFVLDITDPENPPELLGEMTMTADTLTDGSGLTLPLYADMGYTTSSPTMVVMRDNNGATKWYLIMGSGPDTVKGENKAPDGLRGKIAILPLEWLTGEPDDWSTKTGSIYTPDGPMLNKRAFRIPNRQPGTLNHQSKSEGGTYWVPGTTNSFISDLITVDFDVETSGQFGLGGLYRSDAVYFGTVDGEEFDGPDGSTYWNGGGRLFRLVTKRLNTTTGDEIFSTPAQWNDVGSQDSTQYNWYTPHKLLIDAKSPITAAPSVGWDGKTFWVYFGTGRFYDKQDKPDDQINRFFGIREPFDISGGLDCFDHRLNWETITWDVNTNVLNQQDSTLDPGSRGLLQVDDIIVSELASSRFEVPYLKCAHCVDEDISVDGDGYDCTTLNDDQCFPSDLPYISATDNSVSPPETDSTTYQFKDLRKYIAGTSCDSGLDGWFREFHEERERNIGQAALLGGLLTYTGYQPHDDVCQAEGVSFLYGVHFQTGTAWYENVFGTYGNGNRRFVKDKLSLGRGLATKASMHVGSGPNDATAFVQTSTGEIIEIGQENLPLSNTKSGRTGWSDDTQ